MLTLVFIFTYELNQVQFRAANLDDKTRYTSRLIYFSMLVVMKVPRYKVPCAPAKFSLTASHPLFPHVVLSFSEISERSDVFSTKTSHITINLCIDPRNVLVLEGVPGSRFKLYIGSLIKYETREVREVQSCKSKR